MTESGADAGEQNPRWHIDAGAADGCAVTAAELQGFLNRVSAKAPGHVRIRALTNPHGDILRIGASYPCPDDSAYARLPADVYHDAAALLSALELDDPAASFLVFTRASGASLWQLTTLLGRVCLRLAHQIFGADISNWLAALRTAGDQNNGNHG
jgi:hypothetical protein